MTVHTGISSKKGFMRESALVGRCSEWDKDGRHERHPIVGVSRAKSMFNSANYGKLHQLVSEKAGKVSAGDDSNHFLKVV